MAIYLLGCSKGGVGKTTMSVNAAVHLALAGRRVCLVDCDEQLHTNSWATKRLEYAPDAPRISFRVMSGDVAAPMRALTSDYDDVVADVSGRDARELRSAMRIADVVIMPFSAGQFELYAVEVMDELLAVAREYNPALKALAFINKAETNWVRSRAAVTAMGFIDEFPSMRRAETLVHFRSAPFSACAETGLSVFELGRGADKAASEVANLMQEVACLMSGESSHDSNENATARTDEATKAEREEVGRAGPFGRTPFEA